MYRLSNCAATILICLSACGTVPVSPNLEELYPEFQNPPLDSAFQHTPNSSDVVQAYDKSLGATYSRTSHTYRGQRDHGNFVLAVPELYLSQHAVRQQVAYSAPYPQGTIIVDPAARYLYHLTGSGQAMRYLVGVGAEGKGFTGEANVAFKKKWPSWRPTSEMLLRNPETYGPWRNGMKGGGNNPLGARALYLYQSGIDTLYRIHGTPNPSSVGQASSNGCIRMFNQDVIHLAASVSNGTRVVVLSDEQSGRWVAE